MSNDPNHTLLTHIEALMADVREMRAEMVRMSERMPQVSDAAMRVRKMRRNSERNRDVQLPSVDERNSASNTPVLSLDLDHDQDLDKKKTANRNRETENAVFDSYKQVFGKRNSILDERRRQKIRKALEHFSPEDLSKAFRGCKATPFNMGQNENGKRYDSIGLILRDADHIERFMGSAAPDGKAAVAKSQAKIQQLESVKRETPSPDVQAKLNALMGKVGNGK